MRIPPNFFSATTAFLDASQNFPKTVYPFLDAHLLEDPPETGRIAAQCRLTRIPLKGIEDIDGSEPRTADEDTIRLRSAHPFGECIGALRKFFRIANSDDTSSARPLFGKIRKRRSLTVLPASRSPDYKNNSASSKSGNAVVTTIVEVEISSSL
jgi:hypothetical protein